MPLSSFLSTLDVLWQGAPFNFLENQEETLPQLLCKTIMALSVA